MPLRRGRSRSPPTGRPPYDPRDLLRLYVYGYLHQIRSSRRLEDECRRNIEVMWLLGRLAPDHKSIAEFRRMHRDAVTLAGAELIRFARSVGLVRGEWVAIDGSKFRAVSSADSVHERKQLERYLERMEETDADICCLRPQKTQSAHVQLLHKSVNHSAHMICWNQFFQSHWKQRALSPADPLDVTHADACSYSHLLTLCSHVK